MNVQEHLGKAQYFYEQRRYEECMRLCNEILNEHFDNPEAIFIIGKCLIDSGRYGLAHALYMHFLMLRSNSSAAWTNLGRCYESNDKISEAENCFRKALKLAPDDYISYSNLGLAALKRGDPRQAIDWSDKAIRIKPDSVSARHNLALSHLALGNWKEGWENLEYSIGHNTDRFEYVFGDEPRWDGSKGKVVVAYGEQGLGDEIAFASCVPDLIKDCSETIIHCHERLEGLFKRSFRGANVYGTRMKQEIPWLDSHTPEARVAFGSLPKFYRNNTEDFPGTPYLVADPERRIQWRALLDSLGDKPKIGISWKGGRKSTQAERRSVSLEDMLPILRQDATFISLQYRDSEDIQLLEERHGIKVHHWKRAAEAQDYDDTAALVAELDLVVSVTTAVIHLSGALGVPCLVLTPKQPRWFYGQKGTTVPWYKSVELIRQTKDWQEPINEAAVKLRQYGHLHRSSKRLTAVA
jgi:tetratricopeptide (TPR) repeat protein